MKKLTTLLILALAFITVSFVNVSADNTVQFTDPISSSSTFQQHCYDQITIGGECRQENIDILGTIHPNMYFEVTHVTDADYVTVTVYKTDTEVPEDALRYIGFNDNYLTNYEINTGKALTGNWSVDLPIDYTLVNNGIYEIKLTLIGYWASGNTNPEGFQYLIGTDSDLSYSMNVPLSYSLNDEGLQTDAYKYNLINYVNDCHALILQLDVSAGAQVINYELPISDYNTLNNGRTACGTSRVVFKGYNGATIKTVNFDDLYYYQIDGNLTLNLKSLGVYQNVDYIIIYMEQTFSYIPGGYLDYMINYPVTITQGYDDGIEYSFERVETVDYTRVEVTGAIPQNTQLISFDFDEIPYFTVWDGTYYAQLILYDSSGVVDTLNLQDYEALNHEQININIPYATNTYTPNDLTKFELIFYLDPTEDNTTWSEVWYYNTLFNVTFNSDNFVLIHYYSQGSEFFNSNNLYGELPLSPDNLVPPTGLELEGWYTQAGEKLELDKVLSKEKYPDNELFVYARFVKASEITDTEYTPERGTNLPFDNILTAIGWETAVGYTIVFILLIISLDLFLIIKLDIPVFILALIDIAILGLFHYWGVLPNYVTVLGYVLFLVSLVVSVVGFGRSSVKNE